MSKPGFRISEWLFSTDHKRVGVLYMVGSFAAFFVAGIMAMLMRTELAHLGPTVTDNPGTYHTWLYFHGAAMILGYQIPALTGFFANYYVPLMIGAKDVAFPRLNSLSVWLYLMGIVLALLTFFVPDPPDILWTGYPPYSVITAGNTALYTFTVLLIGFSSIAGGVNFLTTIIYMRAPGVKWSNLNVFIWSIMTAFVLQLIFVPILGVAVTMISLDKYLGTNYFNAALGGDPLIYQNLFWFYSHPAVYVIFIPAIGIIFEIVATFSRNRIFNYKGLVVGGLWGLVFMSGIVWVHHLYVSGVADWLVLIQVFSTLLISVPVGLLIVGLIATLYRGSISFKTPMFYAMGFLFFIFIGGLTGIPNAMSAIYIHLTDTYWMPGHFHYVMALSVTTAIIGGTYYVFPKLTGRMYSERLGVIGFLVLFIGFNVTFATTLYMGAVHGMPRRYYDYQLFPQIEGLQQIATYGSYVILLGALIVLVSWIHGLIWGKKAPQNPWGSRSLEWTHAPSPPPPGNYPADMKLPPGWNPYGYGKTDDD